MKRAVFLDKDGTLVENVPYSVDPARIRLMPGAAHALHALAQAGFLLVVVSNQPGIARGMFQESALRSVERRIRELAGAAGVALAACYWCPHHPDGTVPGYAKSCECRKPAPGMLQRAAREHDLALAESWMVGDILDDVEAGHRAGCRAALVDTGGETEWVWSPLRRPDVVARNLAQAAAFIVKE